MEKDALFMSVIVIADDKKGKNLLEKVPLKGHHLDDDDT
jgi:hypothetical protein